MEDETEQLRRRLQATLNADAAERKQLEAQYGQVWDTSELQRDFEVQGFMAPFCVVKRRSDGKRGAIMFQHAPRFYFSFLEE